MQRFAELETFGNVFQLPSLELRQQDFKMKGKWGKCFFENTNPIILELGCGKGEYTIGLGQRFTDQNFIGMDIKGSRIWKGAKYAIENHVNNVAFVRCHIEQVYSIFSPNEVSEIWLTFPDPQKKKERKRLTHPIFLDYYR